MIKLRIAAVAAMLAVTGAAVGGNISATVGLTSDYDFRGISQTLNDPAFQVGLTYTGDVGIYYGLWGSNVDFQGGTQSIPNCCNYPATYKNSDLDRPSHEIDVFVGFSGEKVVGYDVGVIYYTYPNKGTVNYPEVYGGITKGPLSLKVWYSWAWRAPLIACQFCTVREPISGIFKNQFDSTTSSGEVYTEGNLNVPMTEGFNFLGHFGFEDASDWSSFGNYYDWSVGFGYTASNFTVTMKYIDGSDLKTGIGYPKNLGRFVFGATTTLPWGK